MQAPPAATPPRGLQRAGRPASRSSCTCTNEQAFFNATLQTELLQLKEAEALRQKEPAEEAPASAEVELADMKAALLAAEARQREL